MPFLIPGKSIYPSPSKSALSRSLVLITCIPVVSMIGLFLHVICHKIKTTRKKCFCVIFETCFKGGITKYLSLTIVILCQGAIFLYYAGRIKQVQGNLDEVSICPKHS